MVSVGIDISKGKSTICMMRPYGEIVLGPIEISHEDSELRALVKVIKGMNEEVKVVMEATGIYHLPVLTYLKDQGLFVAVINPYRMKQYRIQGLRRVKTDKADSMAIAKYGIDNWYSLKDYIASEEKYTELTLLSRQYRHYMRIHVASLQELTHILDYTMPGLKGQLKSWVPENGKDKLADFVEQYWHYDIIRKKSERQFIVRDWNESHERMSRGISLTEEQAMKMTKALVDRYRTRANQEHAAPAPIRDDYAR